MAAAAAEVRAAKRAYRARAYVSSRDPAVLWPLEFLDRGVLPPKDYSPLRCVLPAVLDEPVNLHWTIVEAKPGSCEHWSVRRRVAAVLKGGGGVSFMSHFIGGDVVVTLSVGRGSRQAAQKVPTTYTSVVELVQRTGLFSGTDLVLLAPYLEALNCIQCPDATQRFYHYQHALRDQPAGWSLYETVGRQLTRTRPMQGLVAALGPPPWDLHVRPPWALARILSCAVEESNNPCVVVTLVLAGAKPQHGLLATHGQSVFDELQWGWYKHRHVNVAVVLLLGARIDKRLWRPGVGWSLSSEDHGIQFMRAWPCKGRDSRHADRYFGRVSRARVAWATA